MSGASAAVDPWEDRERASGHLTKVEAAGDDFGVTSSTGWSCIVRGKFGVTPKVGDFFVTWGSIGFPIRGQAINGHVLYYRTPEEQEAENQRQADAHRAKKIADYEGQRTAMDARVAALPPLLRERVEGFRERGGDEWRWSYEDYELMCCEESARLIAHFPDAAALRAFVALEGFDDQKAAYPAMGEGHSGNSWGFSCNLALMLLEGPLFVGKAHGAMCPLVGCKDYRCWSTTLAVTP